jgi:hypothetical protein
MILTVHVVVNWVNDGVQCELLSISSTNKWKIYCNEALEHCDSFNRLVRPHAKLQPIAEVVIEEEEGRLDEER